MNTEAMQAPVLVQRLVQAHGAQWVGLDDADAFTAVPGARVLFFCGDPVRFPEALDVAVGVVVEPDVGEVEIAHPVEVIEGDEHVAVADGVSKRQINEWKIRNLGRTIEGSFGLGDSMLLVFLTMSDGRVCQFMYAPVTARLQEIGEKCGDYLHAIHPDRLAKSGFWDEFRSLVTEGCHLLELACSSEILKPTVHSGLHFCLPPDDQRMGIVQDLIGGATVVGDR